MKKVLIALLTISQLSFAQTDRGNGRITGTITDTATKEVVEFATVALTSEDGKTIDGAVADAKGKFTLSRVPSGKFNLVISFVGYETKSIPVEISDRRNVIDLGSIAIGSEAKVLGEVVVEGERSLIEEKVDRTIYNAENDATTAGGDATDVLKRVPMLTVDFEGNVSLRGSQNVMVLINNKPSTIMASSVADALRQIPAEQIKSVEVITSPSAKYDAEGTGGIINIITKKNTLEGATMNINSSAGFRGSNLGLNGNYRTKKLGLSLGGWGRGNYNVIGRFNNEQITKDPNGINPEVLNNQQADTRTQNLFGNVNLGFDYDINKYNALTGSVRLGSRSGWNYQDGLLTQQFINNSLTTSSLRDVRVNDISNNLDLNLTYTKTFEKPQQEFSVLGLYSRNNRNNDFENLINQQNGIDVRQGFRNLNDSYNQEVTFQMDYQTPIQENQMIEVGAKNIWRQVFSNFSYRVDPDGDGIYVESPNPQLTNNLNYDQNVSAGYLSYSLNTKSGYGVKAGARYEYTTINAFSQTESNIEIPDFGVFVPSVNVSRKIKNATLKAAYNRRVQRPSIQFLNPNIQAANPLNVSVGNPQLDPELTDNFELSISKPVKSASVNLSTFARNTNNSIQRIREVRGDTILTTFQNIGKENAYGMGLNVNIMSGKLTLSGGGDVYYAVLTNNDPNPEFNASNEGFVYSGRLFGGYQLKNNWALQAFGFYRGRQVQLQGFQGGFGVYSLSLNKNFNNKKGNIGFGIENFLQRSMKINNETFTPTINQRGLNELFNFNAKINFSYRIGKMSFDQRPKRRKSINNDDMKDGGGMDMGGGMNEGMQAGGAARGGFAAGAAGAAGARPAAKPELPQAATDTVYQAAGVWVYTVDSGQPGSGGRITITKDGDNYAGSIKNERMPQEVKFTKVTVDGNKVTFMYTMNFGGNEVTIDCTTVINENEMTGTMNIGSFRSFPIKATRE
ncbi:MAG: TonB-dependent receptor [Cyclobacteriaceae bacterium]|jgi:outer membrane receptor for ferrienterochelin and colicin|nr:TonB-dependent receptor [Cyclobacteriaceae bacterium]